MVRLPLAVGVKKVLLVDLSLWQNKTPGAPRQANLLVHLQTTWSLERIVNQIGSIGHADNEHIIQRINAVNLAQQLIDHRIVNSSRTARGAALLADCVQLVKNDDVQPGGVATLGLLLLGFQEEFANVCLALANVLVQNLGSVDHL